LSQYFSEQNKNNFGAKKQIPSSADSFNWSNIILKKQKTQAKDQRG